MIKYYFTNYVNVILSSYNEFWCILDKTINNL